MKTRNLLVNNCNSSNFVDIIQPSLFVLDDLHDARNQITELTRRLHELEIELRRLENEREELTAAYKEAEAVSFLLNEIG